MTYLIDDYLKHAARNEGTCLFIDKKAPNGYYFRWGFVVAYYTALSYFNAFLLKKEYSLPTRHKQYGFQQGDVEMAIDRFCLFKEDQITSVGTQYEQLYQWSCDVRYSPKNSLLLNKSDFCTALEYLNEIKKVTKSEVGYVFKQAGGKLKRVN
ncbi:MAG: hypothetical protein ACWGHO_02665 [Candidatus Moraniibacteriota bacterium]